MTSEASAGSMTEKPELRPSASAQVLTTWWPTAWKVPPRNCPPGTAGRPRPSNAGNGGGTGEHVVSGAAGEGEQQDPFRGDPRLQEVRDPCSVSARVLPVPAPATITSGPSPCRRCQLGVVEAVVPSTGKHTFVL